MRVRTGLFVVVEVAAVLLNESVLAFSPFTKKLSWNTASVAKSKTRLDMSSVPNDDFTNNENNNKMNKLIKKWRKKLLPPPPEDQLIMTGDVAALFVYSFMDHSLNELMTDNNNILEQTVGVEKQVLDPILLAPATTDTAHAHIPVWFDSLHTNAGAAALSDMSSSTLHLYSPVISTAGTASVVLTTCWLLSGYINHAFLFRNTLHCNVQHALAVTGKTWLGMAVVMVMLSIGSDYFWGHYCDCLHSPSLGGLTKADADYIFDSLSVLVIWRFVVSWMLGYGK